LYLAIAALVQRFDFKLDGAGPKDVECIRDLLNIRTEDESGIKAFVSRSAHSTPVASQWTES
jgi:hypothetical protein